MLATPRTVGLTACLIGLGAIVALNGTWRAAVTPGCDIAGNISPTTGERIYHLPGQRYYERASIRVLRGERWFCTEAEALRAGWRKSRV